MTSPKLKRYGNLLLLLLQAGAVASFADSVAPVEDSRPPAAPAPHSRPLSDDYRVLLTRSVFARDHNRARVAGREAPTTQAVIIPDLTAAGASEAEANFILKGVTIEDGLPTAFFEQTADQQTVRVHAGQTVSHGQVSAITLDGINYLAGEKLSHVIIGQALDGGLPAATTQPTTDSTKPVVDHPAGDKPKWWRKRAP